jgi:hypothetical protein
MASKDLLEFSRFIRERIGSTEGNEPGMQGLLDAYGLTGAEREDMIEQLHKAGVVKGHGMDLRIVVEKLPAQP